MSRKKRGRGRPSDYKAYVRHYNALNKEMKKRGLTMAEGRMNKLEWKTMREALINTRKDEIAQGKRKTLGNINKDLAKMQQYAISREQAKAYQKAIKATDNKKVSLRDIRAGKYAVNWDVINAREKELRAENHSWNYIHDIIAQEYFGS